MIMMMEVIKMDWLPSISDSDLAFIIVLYVYLMGGFIISLIGVLIYTKFETRKPFKEIFKEFI